ncbi:MAG: lytic transglycosylase domain-containing protein [Pseudomonadota bacterium]
MVLRIVTALALVLSLAAPVTAQDTQDSAVRPPSSLGLALQAVSTGRWSDAKEIAGRDGPAAQAVIEYARLYAGRGTPEDLLTFLNVQNIWPDLGQLRRRNEEKMAEDGSPEQVMEFYEGYTPRTGIGALSLAAAQASRNLDGDAKATLVLAWRTLDLTTEEHNAFMGSFSELLKEHHDARLQMALWRGLRDVALMLPLVDDTTRGRAELRQRVEKGERFTDDELSEGARVDPGLSYARFNQHIRADRDAAAIETILRQSAIEGGLGEAARWSGWRRALARKMMREGEPDLAYRLASTHQMSEGSAFSDLEWLSGYIALTYLEQPELALDHFQRFRAAVASPISLGRAGYWIGRAQDAMGDTEAAQISYAFGADYQTSFYGLLAAEKAGITPPASLRGERPEADWRNADFAQKDVFKAGVLLVNAGRLSQAEQYFVTLAATLSESDLALLGAALEDLDSAHLQVMVGKAAAKRGLTIVAPYYALHPMTQMDLPVEMELALAIARRESEFDFGVKSGAGAEGLMQLMPGTASDVARDLGLAHSRAKVLSDWRYNATLGSEYLAQLVRRFDGNVVMVSAGYNAGPRRPLRWMETYGDPRKPEMDMVDWIEHIPFRETRNYVMRVAESLPVYRARLGKDPLPVPFSQELQGGTLKIVALQ